MNPGVVGGVLGGVVGFAGGLFGTYCSIKNTKGPRERAFMIKSALVGWTVCLVFLALLFVLPSPYRWFMWVPYAVLLPGGVIYGNRAQQRIRREESPCGGTGAGR